MHHPLNDVTIRFLLPLLVLCGLLHFPAAAGPSKARIGEVHVVRKVCANGLKAAAIHSTNQTAAVYMIVGAGGRHETPSTTGLAHLTEHAMFSGTPAVGPDELERRVRAVGGRANAYTRHDYTLYYDVGLPPASLREVLIMEADRLQNLSFDKAAFLREQKSLEEEEHATHSISDELDALVASVVYPQDTEGVPPPPEGHTHGPFLSIDAVKQFYSAYYRPHNTAVVVVCPLPEKETLRCIEDAFAPLARMPEPPGRRVRAEVPPTRRKELASRLGRRRVEYAWRLPPVGHKDGYALDVLEKVLHLRGLQLNPVVSVRQDKRLDGGLLRLYAAGDDAQQSLDRLLGELAARPPGRDEVRWARESLRQTFVDLPVHTRPYFSLPAMIGVYEVLGLPGYIAGYAGEIDRVSAGALGEAGKRYLGDTEKYAIVFKQTERKPIQWPTEPASLIQFAQEADASGDSDLAIEAYTRLLAVTSSKMYQTIYLATRGQLHVKIRDYDAAVADFEAALKVTDYPALKPLLEEAKMLQRGFTGSIPGPEAGQPSGNEVEPETPSGLKEELMAMIPALSKELEEWRGLEFKRPVQVTFVDSAPGMLKGWYDVKTASLVVTLQDSKPRFSRGVLLHELYHALQDQHFDLANIEAAAGNDDSRRAVEALIEGEAMLAVSELMEYDFREHARLPEKGPITEERFQKIFHYGAGMGFVEALRKKGGWEAVATAFRSPPQTTREIYCPEIYPARRGRPESFPAPDGEVLERRVAGCYDLYLLLAASETVRGEALDMATRVVWAEQFQLRSGDGRPRVSWVIGLDRKKDAKRLAGLLAENPADFPWRIDVRDTAVVLKPVK